MKILGGDMRELPEPDLGIPAYTKELVLSIQKQAYEDGLKEAREHVAGLVQASGNLLKVRGRYHTEQAYKQLEEAFKKVS